MLLVGELKFNRPATSLALDFLKREFLVLGGLLQSLPVLGWCICPTQIQFCFKLLSCGVHHIYFIIKR